MLSYTAFCSGQEDSDRYPNEIVAKITQLVDVPMGKAHELLLENDPQILCKGNSFMLRTNDLRHLLAKL